MDIKIIYTGARYAVAELTGCNEETAAAFLNGKEITLKRDITFIGGLKPETEYSLSVDGDSVSFRTDYEFVTLDV